MHLDISWLTLDADAPVDLQMHTTFSDGKWTAEELLDYVAGESFALIAVTDHDQVASRPRCGGWGPSAASRPYWPPS